MGGADSRVTIHMAASLDGFVARRDGRVDWLETGDAFEGGVVLDAAHVERFLASIDCWVMGSRTYETALDFEARGHGWVYGDTPTFVLTTRELPKSRASVELYAGDLAELVEARLRPAFRSIWFVGGGAVCGECLRRGLADEVRYTVVPVLIGDGIRFFQGLDHDVGLHLLEATAYADGTVELRHEVRGKREAGATGAGAQAHRVGPEGDETDPEAALRASWRRNADAWTRAVRERRIESRRAATDAAIVRAVLEERPERVLDVGCGEGWLARALAAEGVEVAGFDGSAPLVERAREAGGGRFEVLSYDAFADDPGRVGRGYDVAVCNFSLLGRDVAGVLEGCRGVLRDGGRLLVQTVHPLGEADGEAYEDGWRREDFQGLAGGFEAAMPWYFRTLSSWTGALAAAGFSLEAVEEPRPPGSGRPASLLLVARAR